MFTDGAGVRKASTTTATRQDFAQPELHRKLVSVPPRRRESAGGHGAISRTTLWSFNGQIRKPANVGLHTKTRTMENSQVCAVMRKADVSTKVGQNSLHSSKHTAKTETTSCPQCCFKVTPLRHRLDCSVFCHRSLQYKHQSAAVVPDQRCTVCKTRSIF